MKDSSQVTVPRSALASLLWAKGRIARHWIASVRTESKLKVGFVSASAIALLGFAFLFSFGLFRLFERFGSAMLGVENNVNLTDLVLERMLSMFSLTVFVLLILSNVLVAFATLYRSKEVVYLVQAPMAPASFFLGRLYECISFSSWSLAFLGSPMLIAYGVVRGVSPGFYLALPFFFIPFVIIPACIGASLTAILVRLFAGRRVRAIVAVAFLALVGLFAFFRDRGGSPDFDRAETIQAVLDTTARAQSPYLPSSWLAEGLLGAANNQPSQTLFFWLLLVAYALFAMLIATRISEALFYRGWTNLRNSDDQSVPKNRRQISRLLEVAFWFLPEPHRSLVLKDFKLFWRDPAQWSQFLIFFGMLALYVANIRPEGMMAQEPYRQWIALLNIAASMLVLATLTTRFVFPLISLEGRRFWILGLAPLRKSSLLWQKFLLSVAATSAITLTVAIVSGFKLGLDRFELGLSLFSVAATTVALSGLAVGLGSLYPNFEEDNPSRITSGMGGTLNFILSLVYVVGTTVLQGVLLQWHRLAESTDVTREAATAVVVVIITVLSLITCGLPMALGRRNLMQAEF
jgi:ABC-2 type transport system permease protein